MGKQWKQWQTFFSWAPESLQIVTAATKLKTVAPWKKSYNQPRQHIKEQRHYFTDKGLSSQGYGFSSSHVWMWELDHKESWAPKNWCFWTVVLEKTLESPLDCKEIQPVNPKGNQSWIIIGRTDVEAEAPILWPPDTSSVQFSPSVMSNSLWPHGLQHTKLNCPSLTPRAILSSHPLSLPSPPGFSLSQHQSFFQWVSSSHQVVKVLEFQLQHFEFTDWSSRFILIRYIACSQKNTSLSWAHQMFIYSSKTFFKVSLTLSIHLILLHYKLCSLPTRLPY